jgi:hypothetical protein
MRRTLTAAFLYGLAMFAAGFALGTAREFLLLPMAGMARETAERLELPLMLAFLAWVAFRLVRAWKLSLGEALAAGLGGASLLALLDLFLVGLVLRGLTLAQALASFDPRTGTLFPFALAISACLPALAAWRRDRTALSR